MFTDSSGCYGRNRQEGEGKAGSRESRVEMPALVTRVVRKWLDSEDSDGRAGVKEREASQASGLSTWEDEAAFSEPGLVGDHQGLGCGCAECETPVRPPRDRCHKGRAVQGTDIWESSGWSWWLKS